MTYFFCAKADGKIRECQIMMAVMQGIAGVHGWFNRAMQRVMTF